MPVTLKKTGAEQMDARNAEDSSSAGQMPSRWAYQLAVMRHYQAVYGYSAVILGSGADAEDVTQETFLRFGQRGGNVRRTREWLLSVARNLCFDKFRSAAKLTTLDGDTLEAMTTGEEPLSQLEHGELGTRLNAMIAGLPEPQRSLVVLFDIQGMNGDECARILDLNINQVKVYLHRARRRLRQRMGQSNG